MSKVTNRNEFESNMLRVIFLVAFCVVYIFSLPINENEDSEIDNENDVKEETDLTYANMWDTGKKVRLHRNKPQQKNKKYSKNVVKKPHHQKKTKREKTGHDRQTRSQTIEGTRHRKNNDASERSNINKIKRQNNVNTNKRDTKRQGVCCTGEQQSGCCIIHPQASCCTASQPQQPQQPQQVAQQQQHQQQQQQTPCQPQHQQQQQQQQQQHGQNCENVQAQQQATLIGNMKVVQEKEDGSKTTDTEKRGTNQTENVVTDGSQTGNNSASNQTENEVTDNSQSGDNTATNQTDNTVIDNSQTGDNSTTNQTDNTVIDNSQTGDNSTTNQTDNTVIDNSQTGDNSTTNQTDNSVVDNSQTGDNSTTNGTIQKSEVADIPNKNVKAESKKRIANGNRKHHIDGSKPLHKNTKQDKQRVQKMSKHHREIRSPNQNMISSEDDK